MSLSTSARVGTVFLYTLYRAMSMREHEQLEREGFATTFRRRWKFFTLDPEYVWIVMDEFDYGLWREKYQVVVRFDAVFSSPLEELARRGAARLLRERGYRNVALRRAALPYIVELAWMRIDPEELPKPTPYLVWISKRGIERRVYSPKKARRVLSMIRDRARIIYINPMLS